jgi:Pyruvate/2-oxoacid:ferredoxin oxidoreductase gamma subunit
MSSLASAVQEKFRGSVAERNIAAAQAAFDYVQAEARERVNA